MMRPQRRLSGRSLEVGRARHGWDIAAARRLVAALEAGVKDKDEAQRLARRAAGGDIQAARRLVALLERSAKAPSLETEERAAWATFSTRRLELVRRTGAWTLLCPVCGNDDLDEFGHVELVTHTRGVAGATKGLLAFDGTSDWGHDGQLSGTFCKRCDSLFDVPAGVETDFGGMSRDDFDDEDEDE